MWGLAPHAPVIIKTPMNWRVSQNLVEVSMNLMASTYTLGVLPPTLSPINLGTKFLYTQIMTFLHLVLIPLPRVSARLYLGPSGDPWNLF